ncbi:MAG: cysteine hydrolase [Candidatus Saccharicenans sp.]|nr:cysteine hydrolase [Candidatus Saccharicenans sp.]
MGLISKKPKIEKRREAVFIIDWQNFFADPDSPGYLPSTRTILPGIANLLEELSRQNVQIIATRHYNPVSAEDPFFRFYGRVIEKESKLFELAYPLTIHRNISVLDKTTYSVFKIPGLVQQLKNSGVTRAVLCGLQTDKCVLASAYDGFDSGFDLVVIEDACCARKKNFHLRSLDIMKRSSAKIMTVDRFIRSLK